MEKIQPVISALKNATKFAKTGQQAAGKSYKNMVARSKPFAQQCKAGQCTAETCVCTSTFKTAWATNINSFPQRFKHAQSELNTIRKQVMNPTALTVGEALYIGGIGAECILLFCAGEMVGRGSLVGYAV